MTEHLNNNNNRDRKQSNCCRDWARGKFDYKVDPGNFLWLIGLFHILIVVEDCS